MLNLITTPIYVVVTAVGLLSCIGAATAIASPSNPVYDAPRKPVIAKVNILAVSTSIHYTSGSEQVYLAYIALPNSKKQLVRLVDTYPSYEKGIRTDLLKQQRVFLMMLIRDSEHDVNSAQFYLPDGDLSLFDTSSRQKLHGENPVLIPTYLIMHEKTLLAKDTK